jgi:hypothetical protein
LQRNFRYSPDIDQESGLSQQVTSASALKPDACGAASDVS